MPSFNAIGKNVRKLDALEKAIGRAKYGADIWQPGMLKGKILHSPYPHARILNIDISRAEKMIGVKAVITSKDRPKTRIGRFVKDRTILAEGRVRHVGEAVAAVAAVDEDAATEALELIRVEYEELPAVFDPIEAMRPEAPIIHDELSDYSKHMPLESCGNILSKICIVQGDLNEAWSQADIIHEDSYTTQAVHQGFIEPHAAACQIDSSGKVTLWSSTKDIFGIRRHVSHALNIPMSHLQVIGTTVGGDFGGKGPPFLEPIVVLLASKALRPVGLSLSREEEFLCTYMRERATMKLKLAAKKDGRFTGLESSMVLDIGSYCDTRVGMPHTGNYTMGPYRIPNVHLTTYHVYTNNHPTGHVRGPMTMTQQVFAIESHVDVLAKELGMDPIEIRLKNRIQDGDYLPGSGTLQNTSLGQTLNKAAVYIQKEKTSPQKTRGWGVACGHYCTHTFQVWPFVSNACVKVNEDGTVVLMTGVSEEGGGQHSILAQIVAEVLNISYDTVRVISGNTDIVPHEWSTSGSQTTYRAGMMVKMAAEDVKEQILQLASHRLGKDMDCLELVDGEVIVKDDPTQGVLFADLLNPKTFILGTGSDLRGRKLSSLAREKDIIDGPSSCAHVAQVEVDRETGKVTIVKYFAAHDVGRAINPQNVEGQIQGGVVQGIGYALTEEVVTIGGGILNPNFTDYKMPTSGESPPMVISIIEVPSTHGPFGAKGFAESCSFLSAPAIANAIFDATGVRITSLPITPEKVRKGLIEKVKGNLSDGL